MEFPEAVYSLSLFAFDFSVSKCLQLNGVAKIATNHLTETYWKKIFLGLLSGTQHPYCQCFHLSFTSMSQKTERRRGQRITRYLLKHILIKKIVVVVEHALSRDNSSLGHSSLSIWAMFWHDPRAYAMLSVLEKRRKIDGHSFRADEGGYFYLSPS